MRGRALAVALMLAAMAQGCHRLAEERGYTPDLSLLKCAIYVACAAPPGTDDIRYMLPFAAGYVATYGSDKDAQEMARVMADSAFTVEMLGARAHRALARGDTAKANAILDSARTLANTIANSKTAARARLNLAFAAFRAGHVEEVERYVSSDLSAAEPHGEVETNAAWLAVLLAEKGRFAAIQVVDSAGRPDNPNWTLAHVVAALSANGYLDSAIAVTKRITSTEYRSEAFGRVSVGHARRGDWATALTLIDSVTFGHDRARSFTAMLEVVRRGVSAYAIDSLASNLLMAFKGRYPWQQGYRDGLLAIAMDTLAVAARYEELVQLLPLAQMSEYESLRPRAKAQLATAAWQLGRFDLADSLVTEGLASASQLHPEERFLAYDGMFDIFSAGGPPHAARTCSLQAVTTTLFFPPEERTYRQYILVAGRNRSKQDRERLLYQAIRSASRIRYPGQQLRMLVYLAGCQLADSLTLQRETLELLEEIRRQRPPLRRQYRAIAWLREPYR